MNIRTSGYLGFTLSAQKAGPVTQIQGVCGMLWERGQRRLMTCHNCNKQFKKLNWTWWWWAYSVSHSVISNSLQPHGFLHPGGSSIHGISQARIPEWAAISPGDLPNPGIAPESPALQTDTLPSEPLEKVLLLLRDVKQMWRWLGMNYFDLSRTVTV